MRPTALNGNHAADEHPSKEILVALLEDPVAGLIADRPDALIEHLDACSICDEVVNDQMEPSLDLYRRYRAAVALRTPEPAPWRDLWMDMKRIDEERRTITLSSTPRPASARNRVRWIGAIAASVVLGTLWLWPAGRGAEARAETILREAQRAASAHPLAQRRLHVKTPKASFIRPAVLHRAVDAEADAVRAQFEAAHYDWDDPLNPAAYSRWRDQLKNRSVAVAENGTEAVVDTSTSEGSLLEAALRIDAGKAVIGGRFVFRDQQWVEITQIPDAPETGAPPTPAIAAPSVAKSLVPAVTITPMDTSLPIRELHVWLAIDKLEAGAGTPISIDAEANDRILVTAYGAAAQREAELRAALEGIPRVAVRSEPSAALDVRTHPASTAESVINLTESISSQAHVLAQLANRFPLEVEVSLPLADQDALHAMRIRRASRLVDDVESLGRNLSKDHAPPARPSEQQVVVSADALVIGASEMDRLVTTMYAGTPESSSTWPEIAAQLSRLRQISRSYLKSLEIAQR